MPLTASVTATRSGNELATAGNELATSPVAIVTVVSTLAIVFFSATATGATGSPLFAGGDGAGEPAPVPVGSALSIRRAARRATGWRWRRPGVPLPVAAVLDELSEVPVSASVAVGVGVGVAVGVVPPVTAMPGDAPGACYPRVRRK
jgi:hypothetical protein